MLFERIYTFENTAYDEQVWDTKIDNNWTYCKNLFDDSWQKTQWQRE